MSAATSAGPVVGVLALQGGVAEHARMVEGLGARAVLVRRADQLAGPHGPRVDALILPGGESSAMDRLLRRLELFEPLRQAIGSGVPTLGTCAGLILLADRIRDPAPGQQSLGLLDVTVARNAFGPQLASAEASFEVAGVSGSGEGGRVLGALIRAPQIVEFGAGARPIASEGGRILGATSNESSALGRITGVSFHPELRGDAALHRALLALAGPRGGANGGQEKRTGRSANRPRITSIASGFSSTSTKRRPSSAAAAPVVPLPAKASSTQSPGRDDA